MLAHQAFDLPGVDHPRGPALGGMDPRGAVGTPRAGVQHPYLVGLSRSQGEPQFRHDALAVQCVVRTVLFG